MPDCPVVLVTGAARRIGASIVRAFHARGYRVLIHFHYSTDAARALTATLNANRAGSARGIQADLTRATEVEALAAAVLDTWGRLDVLVNNASAFYPTPFGESTQAQWDELAGSNVRGPYFLAQALHRELQNRQGSIVNIIDTHADNPLPAYPIYSIAKAGLKAMTRSLAKELAPRVRVNGVAPGAILWPPPLLDESDPAVLAKRREVLAGIALGRLGEPEMIAAAALFLARDAHYMTGQVLKVDGGR